MEEKLSPFIFLPKEQRTDVYSRSITDDDSLWVLPTYDVGEVWEWYDTVDSFHYEVIEKLSEFKILFKVNSKTMTPLEKFYLGTRRNKNSYIDCGIPQLRRRIR